MDAKLSRDKEGARSGEILTKTSDQLERSTQHMSGSVIMLTNKGRGSEHGLKRDESPNQEINIESIDLQSKNIAVVNKQ